MDSNPTSETDSRSSFYPVAPRCLPGWKCKQECWGWSEWVGVGTPMYLICCHKYVATSSEVMVFPNYCKRRLKPIPVTRGLTCNLICFWESNRCGDFGWFPENCACPWTRPFGSLCECDLVHILGSWKLQGPTRKLSLGSVYLPFSWDIALLVAQFQSMYPYYNRRAIRKWQNCTSGLNIAQNSSKYPVRRIVLCWFNRQLNLMHVSTSYW